MTYTKGPWTFDGPQVKKVFTNGCWEAIAHCGAPDKTRDKASDNARLIAAAPELLEAIENILDAHDKGEHVAGLYAAARLAVKKARGEE